MTERKTFPSSPFVREMVKEELAKVIVHSPDHVSAALRAAAEAKHPVALVSPPSAARYQGVSWLLKVGQGAAKKEPDASWTVILDCGDAPGLALAALEAGIRDVAVHGVPEATLVRLAELASGYEARLIPHMPGGLDLLKESDPLEACRRLMQGNSPAM